MVARAALLFLPPDRGLMPWAEPPSGTAEKGEKTMLDAYELLSREEIRDVRAEGYLLRHKKTGARIAVLSNEDENKVFSIAFRTPPKNSTGVAPYHRAHRALRFPEISPEGSFCGAGEGVSQYLPERHDLSG